MRRLRSSSWLDVAMAGETACRNLLGGRVELRAKARGARKRRLRRILTVVLAGAVFACAAIAGDWVSIQPDASFQGWTRVPMKPTGTLISPSQWHVAHDGDLICNGAPDKGHEFLRYDHELANFILHVEWRFTKIEGETKYNSGVYVRNAADGSAWYQAQVGPPANGGYFFYVDTAGKRTNLKSEMPSNPVKEPGEWNTYDIRADGPRVTLKVNGVETSHFDCDRLKGYVGLEAEYHKIEFRNIKLQELP